VGEGEEVPLGSPWGVPWVEKGQKARQVWKCGKLLFLKRSYIEGLDPVGDGSGFVYITALVPLA
jgi:hypothetical protein